MNSSSLQITLSTKINNCTVSISGTPIMNAPLAINSIHTETNYHIVSISSTSIINAPPSANKTIHQKTNSTFSISDTPLMNAPSQITLLMDLDYCPIPVTV